MKIGTTEHRDLFCNQFIATFIPYTPESLPWPDLDEQGLERLRRVPFWQEVLHTERRAGAIVKAFATTVADPLVRKAVDLQGFEETRHAELLREMIHRYGIHVEELALEPMQTDVETAFKDFGFGECIDSFLGFGAFKVARQSAFLPESMFRIFDTLMFEETRHVVFFVNWMAWSSVQDGTGWRRHLTSMHYYLRAFHRLFGTIRRGQKMSDGKDFSATQASAFLDDLTFRKFLENCYTENRRRMSEFDGELLRPAFMPRLADAALATLRLCRFERATGVAG